MDKNPNRVLFVSGVPIDIGGIEKSIMDIYRGIEREKLLIDFVVRKPQKGRFHNEIESYGGKIFNLFEKTKHKGNKKWSVYMDFYSIYSFYKILKNNGPYSAVHIVYPHLDGFVIIAAKLAGVPVRIVHSRNTGFDETKKLNLMRVLTRKLRIVFCKRYATHIWGCSRAACEYLFGKDIMKDNRAEVPENPVNIKKFMAKPCDKTEACKQLNVASENINFIHVGRYAPQKNQIFLLNFFAEMVKKRDDLHLLLTGPGPLEGEIKHHIKTLKLENHVTMLDSNTDIPLALAASDYFLLPSIYEGFGNVLIEAQAAGVPCFVSTACQPEPNLGLVEYIPLDKGEKYWAEYILSIIEKHDSRVVDIDRLNDYSVDTVAPRMQRVYLEGIRYKEASSN